MEALFLRGLTLCIGASWLVLAAVLLRLPLRRAPRWISCLLWALVALRLLCPIAPESRLSLVPQTPTLSVRTLYSAQVQNEAPTAAQSGGEAVQGRGAATQRGLRIVSFVWIGGTAALLCHALVSYLRLRRRVATATRLRGNVWQSEWIDTPFVLGLLRPRIYLPYRMEEADCACVLAHERAHLRRRDQLWKPLGFALLAVYWYNPLLWLAYALFCRDMECACDERAVRDMDRQARQDYASALLRCSLRRPMTACPLAFGEVGVKERIKHIMRYKKPKFWVISAALLACAVLAVCFLTSPRTAASAVTGPTEEPTPPAAFADDPAALLRDVLQGGQEIEFPWLGGYLPFADACALFGAKGGQPESLACLDLDGDGQREVVVRLTLGSDEPAYMVLRCSAGHVKGYNFNNRSMLQLKEDGTFVFSGGAMDSGVGRLRFDEETGEPEVVALCASESGYDENNELHVTYTVDGKASDEAHYREALERQDGKRDVNWHNFNTANIKDVIK